MGILLSSKRPIRLCDMIVRKIVGPIKVRFTLNEPVGYRRVSGERGSPASLLLRLLVDPFSVALDLLGGPIGECHFALFGLSNPH